ncbi:hypothetical protein K505DRAFT_398319 [Melanomma pulvis-pyrius CBS 109.77]|uniref:Uncharacterized protein n=1 Tax=Melanomma pulvis-pyrius CBS 109.77 TaxID=1314802 RepID=A0A6A6WRU2_9PLEO|nr:hypothetical protein K505DRAFT_398319 [Melanomma pulvis-pyrius CBS 109.77]
MKVTNVRAGVAILLVKSAQNVSANYLQIQKDAPFTPPRLCPVIQNQSMLSIPTLRSNRRSFNPQTQQQTRPLTRPLVQQSASLRFREDDSEQHPSNKKPRLQDPHAPSVDNMTGGQGQGGGLIDERTFREVEKLLREWTSVFDQPV